MNCRAICSPRASSATVSPYPDLISTVVVPWRRISATSRETFAVSCSSVASRVAATVVRMPPAEYGVPVIRAANSSARSPANTRCECESTNPGITARPPRSIALSAAGASRRGPTHATVLPSITSAAS